MSKKNIMLVFFFVFLSGTVSAAGTKNLLVFPLTLAINDRSLAWLSEGIAASLSFQLKVTGHQVVSQSERMELLEKNDLPFEGSLSKGSMIRIAQQASADFIVMGTAQGSEKNIRISVWLLDVKNMKLSGEIAASGPLTALPQLENELAWMILSNSGLTNTSRESFRSYSRTVPNAAYSFYVQSFHTSSENEQIRLLQKAVNLHGDFPVANFQLGRLYHQKKEWTNAIPNLLRGIGLNDFRIIGQFMLGNCYLQMGNYQDAIAAFSQILVFSRSVEVLNNLGVAYGRIQENASSLRLFLEANSISKTDPTISANLAIAQFLEGNVLASHTVVADALAIHPENGFLQFFQGFLLKERHEDEKADLILTKAKKLGIPVEKLQSEDTRTWPRPFINLISSKIH